VWFVAAHPVCVRRRRPRPGAALFNRMAAEGVAPNDVAYMALLRGLGRRRPPAKRPQTHLSPRGGGWEYFLFLRTGMIFSPKSASQVLVLENPDFFCLWRRRPNASCMSVVLISPLPPNGPMFLTLCEATPSPPSPPPPCRRAGGWGRGAVAGRRHTLRGDGDPGRRALRAARGGTSGATPPPFPAALDCVRKEALETVNGWTLKGRWGVWSCETPATVMGSVALL